MSFVVEKAVMASAQELVPLAASHAQLSWSSHEWRTSSWGRGLALTAGSRFSCSVWSGATYERHTPPTGRGRLSVEKLWREFFLDPSLWWDHRSEKANLGYPDFKHKKTQKSLWLIDHSNPPWVKAELAALAPGTIQSNIFSWNVRLRKYVKAGHYEKTLHLYQQLQQESINPDQFTFLLVLNACSNLRALHEGRRIHIQIVKAGHESDIYVLSSLVDMYAKCGSIEDALKVFNQMPRRDVVSWSALIQGYVKCGRGQEALELSQQMQREGVDFDPITFVGVLNACACIGALEEGRHAHKQIIERGYESDVYVASSLIDMYAKCGSIEDARRVFDKMEIRGVVSWNALILGYVKYGGGKEALKISQQMQREGVELNPVTFVGVLNACASSGALQEGKHAHRQIIEKGYESDIYVASSLVDMYAKCGSIEDARRVFNKMDIRGVVSWTALILGYVKCGQGQQALILSKQMQRDGVELNPVTFVGVLNACASIGALAEGRRTHEQIICKGYECDVFVANALVDMYCKCGSIDDAQKVFSKGLLRDLVSWNAMLAGYSRHGYVKETLQLFEQMCQAVEVDAVSFISVLSACSHGGLVDEGLHYLKSMSPVFNVSPTLKHFACVIDLLGRTGHFLKAEDLIRRMPFKADIPVWMSLLGACKNHENAELGERIAAKIRELDSENPAGYVLLSNIHAAVGKWDKVQAVHHERLGKEMKDTPGLR